ncbi:MAG: hypothetical protein ACRCTE_13110 [Cellulosilyticaceae bacterium]
MADVTFGVKVPEELKNELSEIMKSTELSGKEFMGVLLSSYKLEKSKQTEDLVSCDIEELQRLLSRVQNIYLNMSERAQFVVEEKVSLQKEVVEEKEKLIVEIEDQLKKEVEKRLEVEGECQELKELLQKKEEEKQEVVILVEEQKVQLKQGHLLSEKYEEQISGLKGEISNYERLRIEIEERNEENQKLKNRTDELASEVWFLQREIEKGQKEREVLENKLQQEQEQLENRYQLELKNQLLEQKLAFNHKMDLLKEENDKIQQDCHLKVEELLAKRQS